MSLCSASGGAEVSRPSEPSRPLLPPSRPGAPAVLSVLRPARVPGVCCHAAPRPPLLPHPRCYRSPWRPHPRAGHGAAETSSGASKGLTAEGATQCLSNNCFVEKILRHTQVPASYFQFQPRLHNIPQKYTTASMFHTFLWFGPPVDVWPDAEHSESLSHLTFSSKNNFVSTSYFVTGGSVSGGFAGTCGCNSK